MKRYGYVYKTKNMANGMMYIGLHSRPRFDPAYAGSGIRLIEAVREYGRNNFSVKLLSYAETIEQLNEMEIAAIKRYRGRYGAHRLYNLDNGGFYEGLKGNHRSEETKEKLRIARIGCRGFWKGRHHSDATKEKLRIARSGKALSEEHKEKIRQSLAENPNSGMKGKRHTEESNQKNRLAHLGKTLSKEHRRKMSISHMGKSSGMKGRIPWNKGKKKDSRICKATKSLEGTTNG